MEKKEEAFGRKRGRAGRYSGVCWAERASRPGNVPWGGGHVE